LYLTPFAFGAPTGGNAPCSNMFGTLSTISSHYKIKKQDSGNGQKRRARLRLSQKLIYRHVIRLLPIHCNVKQNVKCTKCELSPCHQNFFHGVSKQDGNAHTAIFLKKLTAVE
ncbi:hypothetical protein T06_515, partial [Trichinella sp. T6]